MHWIIISGLCAVFFGVQGVYIRYLHLKNISSTEAILFSYFSFALPFLMVPAIKEGFGAIQPGFWQWTILTSTGALAGFYCSIKALKYSEASLVMPVLALSPLLVIPVSALMLKEFPSATALISMLIIVIGCYVLASGGNLAAPFKMIAEEKGVRWALLTIVIWSFVASADKIALGRSSVAVYPFIEAAFITLLLLPLLFKIKIKLKELKYLFVCGALNAGLFMTHMAALAVTPRVSYLIAIKRSGILISVVGGLLLFREKDRIRRLSAAVIIIAGNVMLYIFS
ncbi:MAG: EamA family transporter [Candidatus Omnitrophota bacterium]|nr:EamA family transporter [Candidatus Omnitrophota bacterium]MBU2527991.1 DMT family transporter [bacterium]MBU3930114.1 DMT family transporter [bacterium]MBU4122872.1 DMT family transporter [bacterium]